MKDQIIIRTIHRNQCIIKILNLIMLCYFFMMPILVIWGIMDFLIYEGPGLLKCLLKFVLVAVCVACLSITGKIQTKIEKNLKYFIGENIIKEIISEKIEVQAYEANNMISQKSIKDAGITPYYDRIKGSDYIKGCYHGKIIEYCDIKMEQEHETTDDDGHTSTTWVTVFQGPFMRIPLSKELNGYIKILERKSKRRKATFITDLINSAFNKKETSIELENEAFNNKFQVKTSNEELTFYILTPQFMENIMKADEYADGYTNISFINGAANIAIHNGKDAFEIKKTMYGKKRLEESRANMRRDLDIILAIVDEILQKDRLFHE